MISSVGSEARLCLRETKCNAFLPVFPASKYRRAFEAITINEAASQQEDRLGIKDLQWFLRREWMASTLADDAVHPNSARHG